MQVRLGVINKQLIAITMINEINIAFAFFKIYRDHGIMLKVFIA